MTNETTGETLPAVLLERQGTGMMVAAQQLLVADGASFAAGGEMLRAVAVYAKRVHEVIDPIVEAAHVAHRTAVAQRDRLLRPAQEVKRVVGEKMACYETDQRELARMAEAQARREVERRESEARERAEAERRRLQAESDERYLAAAVAAEDRGDPALAEMIVENAPTVAAPPPEPVSVVRPVVERPRAEGVSFRDSYRAEVTDLQALVQAVAAGAQPLTLLQPNMTALNQMARALREQMQVPGVRVAVERTAVARAREEVTR